VYRYVPRRNDAVNQTWMCDEGRLTYKRIGADDRIDQPAVRGADGRLASVDFDDAITAAADRIRRIVTTKGAGAVGLLVSPHATNEDLAIAKHFADAIGTTQTGFALVRGRSDAILIHEEKAANAAGARALGFEDAAGLLSRAAGGAVEALIVMGQDVLAPAYAESRGALERVDTLVLLDVHRSHLESLAHVVLPTRHALEKHGTLTNAQGLVQRVQPAVEPSFDARSEGEILWRLAQALGLPGFAAAWEEKSLTRAEA
jgi:NADH-quinone oxidoreductase subunit G